jgi:hypothetical protein
VRGAASALLLLAGVSACASSPWATRRSAAGVAFHARLYAPRLYAPLVPGSAYPNKREPIPARGRPGVVLVAPGRLFTRAASPLADRGLVVLRLDDVSRLAEAAAWLARQPECEGAPIGAELAGVEPPNPEEGAPLAAIALVGGSANPSTAGPPLFVARTVREGETLPDRAGSGTLNLYRAPDTFRAGDLVPRQAWKDAAEWLADALRRR